MPGPIAYLVTRDFPLVNARIFASGLLPEPFLLLLSVFPTKAGARRVESINRLTDRSRGWAGSCSTALLTLKQSPFGQVCKNAQCSILR
jgi:hypothetical protein